MTSEHNILILGGNFAGVSVAHYLLRHTIPALEQLHASKASSGQPAPAYKVTVVNPTPTFYFKVAAPRVVASPEKLPLERTAFSIADAFAAYPPAAFEFVHGLAVAVDDAARTVRVERFSEESSSSRQELDIPYASLVIATGTTSSPLWSVLPERSNDDVTGDAFAHTRAAAASTYDALQTAKSVLIAGAGAVGVELAGEIATAYPSMRVTLATGPKARVLPAGGEPTSRRAEERLEALGVEVLKRGGRVIDTRPAGSQTRVVFEDGSSRLVDLYVPATGGRPNSALVPAAWRDARSAGGRVRNDPLSLRVEGAAGVYAIGDVARHAGGSAMAVASGVRPLASALGRDVAAGFLPGAALEAGAEGEKKGEEKKKGGWRFGLFSRGGSEDPRDKYPALKVREYSAMEGTQIVPTGPNGGVGEIMGWGLPSWFVWAMKSRNFFVDRAESFVKGDGLMKV